jgi:hypothetical protein
LTISLSFEGFTPDMERSHSKEYLGKALLIDKNGKADKCLG